MALRALQLSPIHHHRSVFLSFPAPCRIVHTRLAQARVRRQLPTISSSSNSVKLAPKSNLTDGGESSSGKDDDETRERNRQEEERRKGWWENLLGRKSIDEEEDFDEDDDADSLEIEDTLQSDEIDTEGKRDASDSQREFASPELELRQEPDSNKKTPRLAGRKKGGRFWGGFWGGRDDLKEDREASSSSQFDDRGRKTAAAEAADQMELDELDLILEGADMKINWRDLLDPTVENVLALVLTTLLAYAVLLIAWQLFIVAIAITLSALKYSVIALILLGILIFLI